ncbi:conserved Plasmodium protein, unknown function [Plasmodium ovale wallikeri]|uniref:Uncharacterized protein n=2 Tax=Plasmodium ovale TaxID=36330 RepID=A0A1A8ZRX1_PLAOA|nr:conserved Plasmodium protein, unknown function [Plasmodium ovale wallikeri]SBT46579.1 conserved Plasmodium protein, unknown function [Plasmodium ovale wallikeri]SBT78936.1 conserved Plasmodium protein, unknown function [Plasmodium ovale]
MVTTAGKKKKAKIKAYDIDESKRIFLYAYEHQLKNEKISWNKAEELKITKHSASSMRGHYLNSIKNEISLYLEMYSEEVAKLFIKVKKWKKEEKKKKLLVFQNNLVKQRSNNISLDRITKRKSTNYNKFNSLIISKAFSMKGTEHILKKIENNSLNRRNFAEEKRKRKIVGKNKTSNLNINKNSFQKNQLKQVKIINKENVVTKNKKIIKKKKKTPSKNNVISILEKINKNVHNSVNANMNEHLKATCVNDNTKNEHIEGIICENKNKKKKVKDEKSTQIKLERVHSKEKINNEINALKCLNKSQSKDGKLEKMKNLEPRPARKNSDKNVSFQNKKNKPLLLKCSSREMYMMNKMNKSFDSKLSNDNSKESKKSTIGSIFSYIYKKLFH